ncbi:YrhK family protein [Staphylococcus cohnii]|uniref:YrhK family protein n=1 Tax=Staphylococcus cohnii TaxID=29382 RepID=UPI00374F59DF
MILLISNFLLVFSRKHGSFFNESTILFVIGSIQMLIRPIISIIHDIHINKVMENEKE